jgi:hypothetical protein
MHVPNLFEPYNFVPTFNFLALFSHAKNKNKTYYNPKKKMVSNKFLFLFSKKVKETKDYGLGSNVYFPIISPFL